jgi:hypothetical protein
MATLNQAELTAANLATALRPILRTLPEHRRENLVLNVMATGWAVEHEVRPNYTQCAITSADRNSTPRTVANRFLMYLENS